MKLPRNILKGRHVSKMDVSILLYKKVFTFTEVGQEKPPILTRVNHSVIKAAIYCYRPKVLHYSLGIDTNKHSFHQREYESNSVARKP